jgi:heme o synthase
MKRIAAYFEMTKARLTAMVILTTWMGFAFASPGMHGWLFVHTLLGSWLMASGAAVLNQYIERELDGRMLRTQKRPLPSHRISPRGALIFGIALCALGAGELALWVNLLTCGLAVLTLAIYLWAYTPLKTRSSLSTLIGAIPGAIPPMMGWTAATGRVSAEAWVLFAILFLWQLPHFLAIAWMYREDYARGGFPMLPVIDLEGDITARMILLYTAVLVPVTLLPTGIGMAGISYGIAALVLGAGFFACGAFVAWQRTLFSARRLMFASILYLPILLGCLAWSHRS